MRADQQDVPRQPINMKEFNETLIEQESPNNTELHADINWCIVFFANPLKAGVEQNR